MDLTPYIDNLRNELMAAAEPGEATALAERLSASVASATRLTILDVLSVAADQITADLVPGSVEVRLRGRNPYFVVTRPNADEEPDDGFDLLPGNGPAQNPAPGGTGGTEGPVSRINFRPPEVQKQRIEAAAAQSGLSVNAWLVRAAASALGDSRVSRRGRREAERGGRFVGWVG